MMIAASQLNFLTLTDIFWESRYFLYIYKNGSHITVTSSALQGKQGTLAQDNHMTEARSLIIFSLRADSSGGRAWKPEG